MDMWDHVGYCNMEHGGIILRDPRLKLRRYKASLYGDHSEVFPDAIAKALKKPGDGVIVNDPRGVAVGLGRQLGKFSKNPVAPKNIAKKEMPKPPGETELIAVLKDAANWDKVAQSDTDKAQSGKRIRARALAAEQLLARKTISKESLAALEERVKKRSLHKDW